MTCLTSDMAPHLMQSFEQLRDVLLLCDGSVLPLHLSQLLLLSSDDFEAAEETILCYGGATCRAQQRGCDKLALVQGTALLFQADSARCHEQAISILHSLDSRLSPAPASWAMHQQIVMSDRHSFNSPGGAWAACPPTMREIAAAPPASPPASASEDVCRVGFAAVAVAFETLQPGPACPAAATADAGSAALPADSADAPITMPAEGPARQSIRPCKQRDERVHSIPRASKLCH